MKYTAISSIKVNYYYAFPHFPISHNLTNVWLKCHNNNRKTVFYYVDLLLNYLDEFITMSCPWVSPNAEALKLIPKYLSSQTFRRQRNG